MSISSAVGISTEQERRLVLDFFVGCSSRACIAIHLDDYAGDSKINNDVFVFVASGRV